MDEPETPSETIDLDELLYLLQLWWEASELVTVGLAA